MRLLSSVGSNWPLSKLNTAVERLTARTNIRNSQQQTIKILIYKKVKTCVFEPKDKETVPVNTNNGTSNV